MTEADGELDALLFVARQAFDGDPRHSLVANLNSVTEAEWRVPAPGGARTIADIALHVASAWLAYAAALKGAPGDAAWAEVGRHSSDSLDQLRTWQFDAQARWLAAVTAAAGAGERQPTPWDGALPLREIVARLVAHDFYHAGEINHLRGLLQGKDRWAWEA